MNSEIGMCGFNEADHYANVCGCQGGDATHVIKLDEQRPSVQELDIEERECISCGRIMSDRERVENHGRCEDCMAR